MFLKYEYEETANLVSVYYLVIGSLIMILNNDGHFHYYKLLFSNKASAPSLIEKEKTLYFQRAILHVFLLAPIIYGVIYFIYSNDNWFLAFVFFVLLILEKIISEIQRLLQYQKKFKRWSSLFLIKNLFPFFVCLTGVFLSGKNWALIYLFLSSTGIICLLLVIFYTSKQDITIFYKTIFRVTFWNFYLYLKDYFRVLIYNQLQSFSSKNIPLFDRLLVWIFIPDFISQISIIGQVGSIAILMVDYFLIAYRKKEYLLQNKISNIIRNRKVVVWWAISFIVLITLFFNLEYLGALNKINVVFGYLILVGFYYSLFAVSQHYANYSYWNIRRSITLVIDLCYFGSALLFFYFLKQSTDMLLAIIFSVIIGASLRLVLLVLATNSGKLRAS